MKRVRLMFAWYDIWVGVFVDNKRKILYIFPVPMFGIKIFLAKNYCGSCREYKLDFEMKQYHQCSKCYVLDKQCLG